MFVENTAAFLVDFGVNATINGQTVRCIFDNASDDAFSVVAGTGPRLLCADSASVAVGHSVSVNGSSYTVAAIEPDGTGFKRVILK